MIRKKVVGNEKIKKDKAEKGKKRSKEEAKRRKKVRQGDNYRGRGRESR